MSSFVLVLGVMAALPQPVQKAQRVALEFVSAEKVLPFALQLVASVVLLIAITVQLNSTTTPNWAYTVAAATVSLFFSLVGIVLIKMREPFDKKLFAMSGTDVTVGNCLSAFLFVWWAVAAGIITFQNPFKATGNGYFATWTGFIASVAGLGVTSDQAVSAVSGAGPLLGWLAASVVLVCAVPERIGDFKPDQGAAIYALIIAILSIITAIVFLALDSAGKADSVAVVKMYVLLFFSILWIVAACATTFTNVFYYTGNGYFSVWIGTALAIRAALPTTAEQEARASARASRSEKDNKPAVAVGTMQGDSASSRAGGDAV